ncbi:MAG: DUF6541 family protein [Haloechinothrix sp.]
MPTTLSPTASALTLAIALGVLVVPGLLTGLAAGLRGWLLAAIAPLLTFSIAGIAGQWFGVIGSPFTWAAFVVATVVMVALVLGVRQLRPPATMRPLRAPAALRPLWTLAGHLSVLACLLLAAAAGGYTMLRGMGDLNAIPQGWDAVFHANGIRYLTDTGDSSVTGMSKIAWYAPGEQIFYPNAYHLIAAFTWQLADPLAGAPIAAVLNANAVLMPGMLALSLVAMIREFAGRAVLAGAATIVAVSCTMVFYELNLGPILPYAQALVLLPLAAAVLHRYLNRPGRNTALVLALVAAGLMSIHASMPFSALLFLLPFLAVRWWGCLRTAGRDLLVLLPSAGVVLLCTAPTVIGALVLVTGDYPYGGWPWKQSVPEALESWLIFGGQTVTPQLWLTSALVVGVIAARRLHNLRWLVGTAVLLGVCFVITSTWDNEVVKQLTRPWWNNPYRLVALAGLAMCVIAAHGLAETQAWLRDRITGWSAFSAPRRAVAPMLAVLVLGGWAIGSGLYLDTNSTLIKTTVGRAPTNDPHALPISRDEARAMVKLGELAEPGDWVLNERSDGTAWSYAIAGTRAVAGHFDPWMNPPDAEVLAGRFRDYPTDPQVRDVVERMNVRWVIVGQYGYPRYPDGSDRAPGLRDLDGMPFLELVYRNPDASLYRITARDQPDH